MDLDAYFAEQKKNEAITGQLQGWICNFNRKTQRGKIHIAEPYSWSEDFHHFT